MEGSKLGGLWKVPSLVAFGRFQAWWPLECSMLDWFWKEKEKKKGNIIFTSFHFSPHKILFKHFFH
jgi:hypothetical protein